MSNLQKWIGLAKKTVKNFRKTLEKEIDNVIYPRSANTGVGVYRPGNGQLVGIPIPIRNNRKAFPPINTGNNWNIQQCIVYSMTKVFVPV